MRIGNLIERSKGAVVRACTVAAGTAVVVAADLAHAQESTLPTALQNFDISSYVDDVVALVVGGIGVVIAASFGFMAVKALWGWGRKAFR